MRQAPRISLGAARSPNRRGQAGRRKQSRSGIAAARALSRHRINLRGSATGGNMRRLGLLAGGVLLLAAHSAFAQDTSKGEVSGGWRYYHATIRSSVSLTGASEVNDFS